MTRFGRIAWSRSPGLYVLPPTLMVAMGNPWLGAATLGVVVGTSTLHAWLDIRSAREQHRDILAYAQNATSMGGDPSAVIAALRGVPGQAELAGADAPTVIRLAPGSPWDRPESRD